MTEPSTHHTTSVAIAGAGLSGLCLAQYLRLRGIDVRVYERDPGPFTRPQGYRITVDADGLTALRDSLPPHLYELAISAAGNPGGYFRFTDQRLRQAFKLSFDADDDAERQMDRQVLRSVLLLGLEDRVHYRHEVTAVEPTADGRALLRLENGRHVTADAVIAADGIGSALRDRIAPDGAPRDTGMAGVYGRTPLVQNGTRILPDALDRSGVLALGDRTGRAVFFTTMEFARPPAQAFARHAPGAPAPDIEDYIMWGVVLPRPEIPAGAAVNDPVALRQLALATAADHHPFIRRLIETSDPAATILSTFAAGSRPGPWALPNAAATGDAVHAMPPFGAHGGNTALRDAALLGAKLAAAYAAGGSSDAITAALAAYRDEMIPYAFKAVDLAEGMMRRLTGSKGVQQWVMLKLLPSLHRPLLPAT
ncbi:FAD-dependent oxidoreductase [Myceligenerans indicum]|uniref:FAD-dependent monooxygenase n=1 Tax=Myceligenerans indicum TaxID=2593663 RepID=A0ABS1LIA7_9MICO|nr:NAD(P)/FAD-dependent oxidoreductase [Myceligenerans indicum]MBL0885974.1 FAD-dependent monooxygenase [Myceligenerans indicum]